MACDPNLGVVKKITASGFDDLSLTKWDSIVSSDSS